MHPGATKIDLVLQQQVTVRVEPAIQAGLGPFGQRILEFRHGSRCIELLLDEHFVLRAVQLPVSQPEKHGRKRPKQRGQTPVGLELHRASRQASRRRRGQAMPDVKFSGSKPLLSKIIIIVFLLAILYTLASSFFFLVKDKGEGKRTVRRLTWRIGLSLFLFLMLYVFFRLGWIEPTSRGPIGIKPPVEQPAEG